MLAGSTVPSLWFVSQVNGSQSGNSEALAVWREELSLYKNVNNNVGSLLKYELLRKKG